MTGRARPLVERFWEKVDKSGDCWLWTAATYHNGYGNIWDNDRRRKVLAHRLSYEIAHGAIPVGLKVLHTCDVRACVRPKHLWLGTTADNQTDMANKGRRKKERCIEGHRLVRSSNGRGRCRECAARAAREYRARLHLR